MLKINIYKLFIHEKIIRDKSPDENGLPNLTGFQPVVKDCPAEAGRKEMWLPVSEQKPVVGGIGINVFYLCGYSRFDNCGGCLKTQYDGYRKPKPNT